MVTETEYRWSRWGGLLSVLLLAMLFLLVSLIRAPIPGVNESHYLGKARHFWQPEWCRGDLFLESANSHAVYYALFGWMTTRWPLDQVAVVLRAAQCLLLAWGWVALGLRVSGSLRRTLTAAALFLFWQASGTWSGEWLIGGAESKVWAYGFLMLAGAWGLDRRWAVSAIAGGLAVSFHPVVGCWGLVIAGLAGGMAAWSDSGVVSQSTLTPNPSPGGRGGPEFGTRFSLPNVALAGVLFIAASLPGLIPAVQSLSAPSRAVASEADYLQVAVRLPHHLDPLTFSVRAWRDYGLLVLVWWLLRERVRPREGQGGRGGADWLELWMLAALLIAAGGLVAAWGPRPFKAMPLWELRAKLLKLYPFRLGDMLIPITVCFLVATRLWPDRERFVRWRSLVPVGLGVGAIAIACRLPIPDKILATQPPAAQADWKAACDWIRQNTPPDAVLYAMNENWSLRWYAERPEYFHFKDCPQDAQSIVEWNRRYGVIYQWRVKAFADGSCSAEELADLGRQTGITYLSCAAYTPMEAKPEFSSPYYRVYKVTPGP